MNYLRQFIPLAILIILTSSFAAVAAERGVHIAAICVFAFLPSCIVAIGWLVQDDLFNPLSGIWLSLFLGMGLRAVYMATSASERADALMWQLEFDDLAVGAGIAILGAVVITVGYVTVGRMAMPIRNLLILQIDQSRLLWVSVFFVALALVAAADFFRRTGLDLSSALSVKRRVATEGENVQSFAAMGYHLWIACTIPCVCFYFWFWESLRSGGRFSRTMAFVFFSLASGFAILTSHRSVICVLVVNSLYITHSFGRLRVRQVFVATVGVMLVLSVMLALRKMGQDSSKSTNARDALTVNAAVDSVLGNENFADLGRLTRIYRGVPDQMNYRYGMSYILWLVAPVPRTQWANKPVVSQGLEITEMIYGGRRSATGIEGGGRPPGFIAEVIMNFGWVGIPFLGLIYGIVLRLFQNFHSRNPRCNVLLSVCVFMPISFDLIGGEFSRTLISIFQSGSTAILLLYLSATGVRGDIAVTEAN